MSKIYVNVIGPWSRWEYSISVSLLFLSILVMLLKISINSFQCLFISDMPLGTVSCYVFMFIYPQVHSSGIFLSFFLFFSDSKRGPIFKWHHQKTDNIMPYFMHTTRLLNTLSCVSLSIELSILSMWNLKIPFLITTSIIINF